MEKINFVGDLYTLNHIKSCPLSNLLVNLEYPITDEVVPYVNDKIVLRGSRDPFRSLDVLGVSLANNHIFDLGPKGVADTISYLRQKDIPFIGLEGDSEFLSYLEFSDYRIYACCHESSDPIWNCGSYSVKKMDLEDIAAFIAECASVGKKSVLCIHWGIEHVIYPTEVMRDLAKQIALLGASLIIGHHSHVPMSREKISNCKIYYGLGNFAFDDIDVKLKSYTFKYRQKRINRKSIAVGLSSDDISHQLIKYSDNKIISCRGDVSVNFGDAMKFHRRIIRMKKIKNFLKNPRSISFDKIKRF